MAAAAFEHLKVINRSIRELYRVLKPEGVRKHADEFVLGDSEDTWRQPIAASGQLVRRIARHFQLSALAVIVDSNSTITAPAQVTLNDNSDTFFVELRDKRYWPKPLAALLVHEVSHVFLHHHGIKFPVTLDNEVLTDTTAAFLGFGATMLNGATETKSETYPSRWSNQRLIRTQTQHFGYITLDEFGYILAKREASLMRYAEGVDEGAAPNALKSGRQLVLGERSKRPLVARPLHQRALGSLMGRKEKPPAPGQSIEFLCPNCAQILRIPEAYRQMNVRCKVCDSRFVCYS